MGCPAVRIVTGSSTRLSARSRDFLPYVGRLCGGHDARVDDSIVVEQFKALGDPVRWAIVRELHAGTRCACELSDVAEVSPPLLSHHLKVLREAGLIAGTKRGRWVDYTLDTDALHELFTHTRPEMVDS